MLYFIEPLALLLLSMKQTQGNQVPYSRSAYGIQTPSPQFQAQNLSKYHAEKGSGAPTGTAGARPPTVEASKGASLQGQGWGGRGGGVQLFPRGFKAAVLQCFLGGFFQLTRGIETPAADELKLIPMKDDFGSRKIFPIV